MPKVILRKNGEIHTGEVRPNTNLVVRAGVRQFPFPHLDYGCGMGKCAKCMCKVLHGADGLAEPNWKEKKQLGSRLEQGFRLACQLWIQEDIELSQDKQDLAGALITEQDAHV